jgi:cytoskeletal protein RodZ
MRKQSMQFKVIAVGMGLAVLLQTIASAQEAGTPPAGATQSKSAELPDSPGTVQLRRNPRQAVTPPAHSDNIQSSAVEPTSAQQSDPANDGAAQVSPTSPQSGDPAPASGATAPAQATLEPAAQSSEQPQSPHEALGTAAAETIPTTGIAASRPAGAAVAPAKQRRVRSILIKVGALVGVGVAVGTTLALSQGSPGKPPGSN